MILLQSKYDLGLCPYRKYGILKILLGVLGYSKEVAFITVTEKGLENSYPETEFPLPFESCG